MLCYIAVNEVQKGVVEIINVKAQAVFYLSTLLGGLGECAGKHWGGLPAHSWRHLNTGV